jgi:hypothetical protein
MGRASDMNAAHTKFTGVSRHGGCFVTIAGYNHRRLMKQAVLSQLCMSAVERLFFERR